MQWWEAVEPIDQILKEGSKQVEELEVFLVDGIGISISLKAGVIHIASSSTSWGLGIRTIDNGHIGASSTSDPTRWRECLDAAIASGHLATKQEWKGLPNPTSIIPIARTHDPSLHPQIPTAIALIDSMVEGAAEHPAKVTGGAVDISRALITIANSHDLSYSMPRTEISISLQAIVGDSTGYEFDQSPFLEVDARWVGEQASFLAVHSAEGKEIQSGLYDLILSPIAASQLIGHVLIPALSGRNVHAGRSQIAGLLGKQCTSDTISLYDDPFARGMGSTDWDAEGVPTRRIDFIRQGILEQFAYDLKTAYRYGKESTASAVRSGYGGSPGIGVHNLIFEGSQSTIDDERALYIHDVVGAHTANPLTGDFSLELANACWIEDGGYEDPVRKAMYAGNVFDMLKSVTAVGKKSRIVGSMILPPVRLNNQRIIGK